MSQDEPILQEEEVIKKPLSKEALMQVEERVRRKVPPAGGLISQIASTKVEATRLLMDALQLTQSSSGSSGTVVQMEQATNSDVRIKLF